MRTHGRCTLQIAPVVVRSHALDLAFGDEFAVRRRAHMRARPHRAAGHVVRGPRMASHTAVRRVHHSAVPEKGESMPGRLLYCSC